MATHQKIRILILGGTKFIGKNLIKKLSSKNFIVDIVSRKKIKDKNYNINIFYNIELKKINEINYKIKYDYILDFISKEEKILKQIIEKINFKKYIFISTSWLVKLNNKIRLNKKVDNYLIFKKNINKDTKKYLLNKYNLEKFIYEKSKVKKDKKFYILRLPIILGNEDNTDRLNFYFSRAKNLRRQILIKDKFFLNLLCVDDFCISLVKMLKKNLWPKNMFLEALNLNKITYNEFLHAINKKLNLKNIKLLSYNKSFLRKKFRFIFRYDPFINEVNLKLTKDNIFKITKHSPKKFDNFLKKIKVNKNTNKMFSLNKLKEIKFLNRYS